MQSRCLPAAFVKLKVASTSISMLYVCPQHTIYIYVNSGDRSLAKTEHLDKPRHVCDSQLAKDVGPKMLEAGELTSCNLAYRFLYRVYVFFCFDFIKD